MVVPLPQHWKCEALVGAFVGGAEVKDRHASRQKEKKK